MLLLAGSHCQVLSQTSSSPFPPLNNHSPGSFASAQNRWQLSPTDLQTQVDPLPKNVRDERNAFWFPQLEQYASQEANGLASGASPGLYSITSPELPQDAGTAWVTATFDKVLVIPIPSNEKLLYTEMNFTIEQIIRKPSSSNLETGSSFQEDFAGGSVKYADGSVRTWRVSPRQYSLQPSHTYLMVLVAGPSPSLYFVRKYWDVTSGTVVASRPDEIQRASLGQSHLSGLTTSEAIKYLNSTLPPEPVK